MVQNSGRGSLHLLESSSFGVSVLEHEMMTFTDSNMRNCATIFILGIPQKVPNALAKGQTA